MRQAYNNLKNNLHKKFNIALIVVFIASAFLPMSIQAQSPDVYLTHADYVAADANSGTCEGAFRNLVVRWSQRAIRSPIWTTRYYNTYPVGRRCDIQEDGWFYDSPTAETQAIVTKLYQDPAARISAVDYLAEHLPSDEGGWQGTAIKVATGIVTVVIDTISTGIGLLAALSAKIFVSAATSTGYLESGRGLPDIVNTGWTIVRDFMNLIFILALIVISLGTILRIESYNYKRLLVRLILMALLINFSKYIALSIIQLFNIVITQLLSTANIGNNVFETLKLTTGDYFESADALGLDMLPISIVKLLLNIGMLFGYLALAIMFLIRIVALWVLVILSPVAYALNILPATQRYAKEWWSNFIKYNIWGPVAIFFIVLLNELLRVNFVNRGMGDANYEPLFAYGLALVFMVMAVMVAKKSGTVGSGAIVGMAERRAKSVATSSGKFLARGTAYKAAGGGASALGNAMRSERMPQSIQGWGVMASGFGKALSGIGKATEKTTALPQAGVQAYKTVTDKAERDRKKDVQQMGMDMYLRAGGKPDKEIFQQMNADQIAKWGTQKGRTVKDIEDALEHGGRKAAEALAKAFNRGDFKGNANEKDISKRIRKSEVMARGVKEHEYDANAEKYEALRPVLTTKDGKTDNESLSKSSIKEMKYHLPIPNREKMGQSKEEVAKWSDDQVRSILNQTPVVENPKVQLATDADADKLIREQRDKNKDKGGIVITG